jgi:hypothetical protein
MTVRQLHELAKQIRDKNEELGTLYNTLVDDLVKNHNAGAPCSRELFLAYMEVVQAMAEGPNVSGLREKIAASMPEVVDMPPAFSFAGHSYHN